MSKEPYIPAKPEDLGREAEAWDLRRLDPRNWSDSPEAIPRVKASTMISLRVPAQMLTILKIFARREGIGYQVLLKRWLDDRIREERGKLKEGAIESNEATSLGADTDEVIVV